MVSRAYKRWFFKFALAAAVVPSDWAETVRLNQEENIPSRSIDGIVNDRTTIRILAFQIPLDEAETFQSRFLDKATRDRSFLPTKSDGRQYVRIFVPETNVSRVKSFTEKFGPPESKLAGTRLLAKSTYFVWNPEKPSDPPFELKTEAFVRGHTVNTRRDAQMAIQANDFVEGTLRQRDSGKPWLSDFQTERLAVHIPDDVGDATFTNVIRSAGTTLDEKHPIKANRYPLHGLLGNDKLLADISKRANMSADDWIEKEYLPKVAQLFSELQLRDGIFVEGHTQNLRARIDAKGRIVRFDGKDMHDMMFDLFNRTLGTNDEYLLARSLTDNLPRRLNEHWDLGGDREDKYVAQHTHAYLLETIGHYRNRYDARRNKLFSIFLDEYVKAAEKILKTTLRTAEIDRVIQALAQNSKTYESGIMDDRAAVKLGEVVGSIHRKSTDIRFFRWFRGKDIKAQSRPDVQNVLATITDDMAQRGQFSPTNPVEIDEALGTEDARSRLRYYAENGRIYAYDSNAKTVLGVTHNLTADDIRLVQSKLPAFYGKVPCPIGFAMLFSKR